MPPADQKIDRPQLNIAAISQEEDMAEQGEILAQGNSEGYEATPGKPREKIIRVDMIYDKNRRTTRLVKSAKPKNTAKQLGRYVFTVAKRISAQGVFTGQYHVEIRGKLLCNALTEILGKFGGKSFAGALVVMDTEELKLLYYALPQLEQRLTAESQKPALQRNEDLIFELSAATEFIKTHHGSAIREIENFPHNHISFNLLWTIFNPGGLLYAKDSLGEGRVYRLRSSEYRQEPDQSYFFAIMVEYVEYDGYFIGFVDKVMYKIREFKPLTPITKLPFFPLGSLPGFTEECERLIKRAEKSLSIKNGRPWEYKGHALDEKGKTFNSHGRVVIDPVSYQQFCGSESLILPVVTPLQVGQLTPEQKLLLNSVLYGFSLGDKIWGAFAVSALSDIIWDEKIFDSLVLSQRRKRFLHAMIKSHQPGSKGNFDDIVRDKGRGLIGLFSGPPGVGKTLTAEAIAEVAHRPLYMLSSGELGDSSTTVQTQLDRVLELTEAWKAILLLDEVDVFLVKRDNANLARNSITSVFLRKLEYYQGILLLTSNRHDSIDPAFQSRIHFCFAYQPLGLDAREQVWSTFFARAAEADPVVLKVSVEERKELARIELNGRQIKNVMSISQAYAVENNVPITADDIRVAISFSATWSTSNSNSDTLPKRTTLIPWFGFALILLFAWAWLYLTKSRWLETSGGK
ncbi:P-loop containing nucleoside triphosphate hydrolase protein [Aspergillus varians]